MKIRSLLTSAAISLTAFAFSAAAQQTIVVSPQNQQGWTTADTRPGGTVTFVADPTAPSGYGALKLTTDASTTAKAQYMHSTATPLAGVTELSYWTKQNMATFAFGDPSYQLETCLNGSTQATCGFTTLVFEPYYNVAQGPVVPGEWQEWDVDSGLFWSSRSVMCPGGLIVGSSGGPASYTLAQIKSMCPNAVVTSFGVNIGSNNPLYDVESDLFNFNGTTYDFELYRTPRNKDECKDGGWRTLSTPDGTPFRNQGDCVSYANHNQ